MGDKYTFNLRVITPLFMGGANHEPEIRTQSLNGVFRWWFRVAGGSRKDEERIFGSASDATGRRGLVNLALKPQNGDERTSVLKPDRYAIRTRVFEKRFDDKGYVITGSGWNYLGFSLDQRFKRDQDRPKRRYITENERFTLEVSFHPLAREDDKKKFLAAMWLAFNLGNFGARARRGFGSIGVESVVDEEGKVKENIFGLRFTPNNGEDFEGWLRENLKKIKKIFGGECRGNGPCMWENGVFKICYMIETSKNLKDYTNKIRGRRNKKQNYLPNVSDMLDIMGFLMASHRKRYKSDYNKIKELINKPKNSHKSQNLQMEKVVFGLPILYTLFLNENKRKKEKLRAIINLEVKGEVTRFASPVIFKVLELDKNKFVGMFVIIKRYKPIEDKEDDPLSRKITISILNKNITKVENINLPNPPWKALDNFIEFVEKFYKNLKKKTECGVIKEDTL